MVQAVSAVSIKGEQMVSKNVRKVLENCLGGTVSHICTFSDNNMEQGITIVVSTDKKEHVIQIALPMSLHLDDCLSVEEWDVK